MSRNLKYVIIYKQIWTIKSKLTIRNTGYRDDAELHTNLLRLQIYFLTFCSSNEQNSIIYSFRDVSLSRNEPGRDAGHFLPFRDCPGQSGTAGHPSNHASVDRLQQVMKAQRQQ